MYTMAFRSLLGGGGGRSIIVRRGRAFTVANEVGRGGVKVVASAAFAGPSVASLLGMS